jgi:rhamnulokinase
MNDSLYIAVDLGAGSGRVFLAGLAPGELLLEEVRRFQYPPVQLQNHLRWNLPEIFEEIKTGIRVACERARELRRSIQSVGVDSWGVDYGLIDAEGNLLELPICYRDERTQGAMERVFAHISREEIFKRTGIQFMSFNTLFQLYAHAQEGIPANARKLLLVPDLINFFLTGKAVSEYTNATTTQMLDPGTGKWSCELVNLLGLPTTLLPEIVSAGTRLGVIRAEVAAEVESKAVRVVAPATHDTGSAVAGAPIEDGWAYISSGTWSLVGVERDSVLINCEVARHNFTNEGGAFGSVRFLKNVMGLWILESCRREWEQQGLPVDYQHLLAEVEKLVPVGPLIFPDDPRLLSPRSMLKAMAEQLSERGEKMPAEPSAIAKLVLDSLALRYASVLRAIESLTNGKIAGVQIIGGGSQNNYLNQATANATRRPVLAGPVESTVIGNVLVQAIAAGRFLSLAEARRHVAKNIRLRRFDPAPSPAFEQAARRFAEIEERYIGLD